MAGSLQNIEIESGPFILRELRDSDRNTLWGIVREYSELATMKLYQAYKNNKIQIKKCMANTGLQYLFELFNEYRKKFG